MWTDSRYYIQAEKELYPGWKMMKWERGQTTLTEWVLANLKKESTIGLDFNLITKDVYDAFNGKFKEYKFVHDSKNIVDQIWEGRPKYNQDPVTKFNYFR